MTKAKYGWMGESETLYLSNFLFYDKATKNGKIDIVPGETECI